MYCLVSCVHDHMLGYIRKAKTRRNLGESQEDIHRQYDGMKASTTPRVEQYPTKGYVHHKLHLEDQGALWLTRLNKHQRGGWWDGANMPRRPRTMVQLDENRRASKGESSLFFDLQSMLLVEENCWETCPSGWKIQRTDLSQNRSQSVLTDWKDTYVNMPKIHICINMT